MAKKGNTNNFLRTYSDASKESILKFYRSVKNADFTSITDERRKELDMIIFKTRKYIDNKAVGGLISQMSCTAEKLTTSCNKLGLETIDELAYYYVHMVDLSLSFLNTVRDLLTQEGTTKADLRERCFKVLGIYDSNLIELEYKYDKYFNNREFGDEKRSL